MVKTVTPKKMDISKKKKEKENIRKRKRDSDPVPNNIITTKEERLTKKRRTNAQNLDDTDFVIEINIPMLWEQSSSETKELLSKIPCFQSLK